MKLHLDYYRKWKIFSLRRRMYTLCIKMLINNILKTPTIQKIGERAANRQWSSTYFCKIKSAQKWLTMKSTQGSLGYREGLCCSLQEWMGANMVVRERPWDSHGRHEVGLNTGGLAEDWRYTKIILVPHFPMSHSQLLNPQRKNNLSKDIKRTLHGELQ